MLPLYFYGMVAPSRKTSLTYHSESSILLAGLVSPMPDYRLAWQLNKCLHIRLVKQDDLTPAQNAATFSHYFCYEAITYSEFRLLQNSVPGALYAPQWKKMDYLFLIKSNWYLEKANPLWQKIRELENMQAVVPISTQTIKNKDLFTF